MKLFTQKSEDLGFFPSLFLSLMLLIIPPLKSLFSPSRSASGVSADASRFPYTLQGGIRSAIRVGWVVKEAVDRNESDVRWFVFGDDDMVFFVDNVVRTLSKYDHDRWFYVGSNSESYDQNLMYSFEMDFGGGGFAISHSLAGVLSRVLDSCLRRYGHLYGSDSGIYSCVAELGIALTHEPSFLQLAELWPTGYMDNHGIKHGICRAKERRRALYNKHKKNNLPSSQNCNKVEESVS